MLGGDMASHTGLGMALGAMLFVLASQIQALSRREPRAPARAVKSDV